MSHAHLDHSGNLPSLYKTEFPTVDGTEVTKELSSLLIDDSIKVHKKTHQPAKYLKHQVKMLMNNYASYEFGSEMDLATTP